MFTTCINVLTPCILLGLMVYVLVHVLLYMQYTINILHLIFSTDENVCQLSGMINQFINVKSLIALHMPIKWFFFFKLWGKKFYEEINVCLCHMILFNQPFKTRYMYKRINQSSKTS